MPIFTSIFFSSEGIWCPEESEVDGFAIDFDKILKNVEELNIIAGEESQQIFYTNEGATFKVSSI